MPGTPFEALFREPLAPGVLLRVLLDSGALLREAISRSRGRRHLRLPGRHLHRCRKRRVRPLECNEQAVPGLSGFDRLRVYTESRNRER